MQVEPHIVVPAETSLLAKQERVLDGLGRLGSLLVALSGGTDSAYLAWAAHAALGERALAVTARSPSFSAYDHLQVEAFVRQVGLRHEFIETQELSNPLYVANSPDRCYYCKSELFAELDRLAAARNFAAVAYGINADDTQDFRPGHRAAQEHRVLTPLLDAGLRKAEIRELSRRVGLATWNRPASACLASRIAYGTPVDPEILAKIEKGEALLRELGFRQLRVRYHPEASGAIARIEIGQDELPRALNPEMARVLAERFRQLGFTYVTLDLEGYRQGSFNIVLDK